jgi:glycosyltransferase involved in cell wall biosynthesis
MDNVLWLAPNLNHYKARFLSKLARRGQLILTVLSGRSLVELGHALHEGGDSFQRIDVTADRNNFAYRFKVYAVLWKLVRSRHFDVILMPAERKFLPLIIYLSCLRFVGRYRLVSYNHPMTGNALRPLLALNRYLVKFMFAMYDRIIFYTEKGRDRGIIQGLLKKNKAFFANNTLDTHEIWDHYNFEVNKSSDFTLLFIGRLIPRRRIEVLYDYFIQLKQMVPRLRLVIIGDGPESPKVHRMASFNPAIEWHGAIIDERLIAKVMKGVHLVFMPGDSGLSIVHAFSYGKPYVTLSTAKGHGPEIDYLEDGVNGLLLSGNHAADCYRIVELIQNQKRYEAMCISAFNTAKNLTVESWCEKIELALTF